jgi:hypothetical protein
MLLFLSPGTYVKYAQIEVTSLCLAMWHLTSLLQYLGTLQVSDDVEGRLETVCNSQTACTGCHFGSNLVAVPVCQEQGTLGGVLQVGQCPVFSCSSCGVGQTCDEVFGLCQGQSLFVGPNLTIAPTTTATSA